MEATLKTIGNSVGFVIPKPLRDALHLKAGQAVTIEESEGGLLLRPVTKRRYTLAALLAECDPTAPAPADVREWENAAAVGNEIL